MYSHRSIRQLKADARNALPGRLSGAVSCVLLYTLASLSLGRLPADLAPSRTVPGLLLYCLLTYAAEILLRMVAIGMHLRFLKYRFDLPAARGDLGVAFRGDVDRAVRLCGLRALFSLACMLPSVLCAWFLPGEGDTSRVLLYYLLFFAGILGSFLFSVLYFGADQLFLEFQEPSALRLLRTARHLTRGSRIRLLLFYLSYVPLHLLGLLSLGAAEPWILSYVHAGEAAFYADLLEARKKS